MTTLATYVFDAFVIGGLALAAYGIYDMSRKAWARWRFRDHEPPF